MVIEERENGLINIRVKSYDGKQDYYLNKIVILIFKMIHILFLGYNLNSTLMKLELTTVH